MSLYERISELWERAKDTFSRLKSSKKGLYLCAAMGISAMLLILFSGDSAGGKTPESADPSPSVNALDEAEFIRRTEEELADILCVIDGVGDTKVMVTAKGSNEFVYAENRSERREEEEYVILKKGSEEEALIKTVNAPKITGVVVVCEGGGSDRVKEEVYRAVTAALDIPSGSVHVAKMK